MLQCIICEDWYHTRHLGTEVPSNNFAEMICEACVTKHEFLLHYDSYCLNKSIQTIQEEEKENVDVEDTAAENGETNECNCKKPKFKSPKVSAKFWEDVSKQYVFINISN